MSFVKQARLAARTILREECIEVGSTHVPAVPPEEPAPVLLGRGDVLGHVPALGESVSLNNRLVGALQVLGPVNGRILGREVGLQNLGHVGSSAGGILWEGRRERGFRHEHANCPEQKRGVKTEHATA
jgi:hypothetical protein